MRCDGLVFGIFNADTEYFGPSGQGCTVNFRVASLDSMPERRRPAGVEVDAEIQGQEGM